MHYLPAIARYVVFGVFALSVVVALLSWAVRSQRISPFSAVGRTIRRVSDPFLQPVERRLVRSGGNPVHAGWWLVISVAVAGVVLLWLMDWAIQTFYLAVGAAGSGPRG